MDASSSFSPSSSSNDETAPAKKTEMSPSCFSCVKALQEIVSGLHNHRDGNSSSSSTTKNKSDDEPPPLTLLKAIAGGDSKKIRIDNSEDGVVMSFPVRLTSPTLLMRWTKFMRDNEEQSTTEDNLVVSPHAIATSATSAAADAAIGNPSDTSTNPESPLTIELKCRKCSSNGPEGGARAFLMGPSPLSVVVCHNRIQVRNIFINFKNALCINQSISS